jgi:hypothetical protein
MQQGARFCFSPISLVRYSRTASNRSAKIYRAEKSQHSIAELYSSSQSATLNEYIARIGIGKAITQSVSGGTADAQQAIARFGYTVRNGRQLRRLKVLNALPRAMRPIADAIYRGLAWIICKRGL